MVEILFASFTARFGPFSLFPWKEKKEIDCSLLWVAADHEI